MERDRGVPQHFFRPYVARAADGDANRGRREHLMPFDVERLLQRQPQPLRHPDRVAGVGDVVEEDGELVASEARQRGVVLMCHGCR